MLTHRVDLSRAEAAEHSSYQSAGEILMLCLSKHSVLNPPTRATRDVNMESVWEEFCRTN